MSAASAHAHTRTHPRMGPSLSSSGRRPRSCCTPAHTHILLEVPSYSYACSIAGCAMLQCCIGAMQCDADMQVLNIGPLSLFEHDPGPRDKHCFYRPHGPASNCPAPAVPSLRRQLAADRRGRWSLQYL